MGVGVVPIERASEAVLIAVDQPAGSEIDLSTQQNPQMHFYRTSLTRNTEKGFLITCTRWKHKPVTPVASNSQTEITFPLFIIFRFTFM